MVIQHQVSGPTVALKSVSLLSFYVNALGSNQTYTAFFVVFHKKIPDLWLKGRCRAALVWYTGFQELVPWRWELHHQHAVQVAIHTNQKDVEITLLWSQQSHELTLTAESLDSPGLLKNGDAIPILPLSIGRAQLLTLEGSLKHQVDSYLDY